MGLLERLGWVRAPEPRPSAASLKTLASAMKAELEGNILPYWLRTARHPRNGGFWGEVSIDGRKRKSTPRGALLTCRILWSFSAAYGRDPRPDYLEMARHAFGDLAHFLDHEHGGLYWSLLGGGEVQFSHKQVYAQAFGIYGLAEYHRVTGELSALALAQALFRLIETRAADRVNGGYEEALVADWSRLETDLPDGGVAFGNARSQNTVLHVMEAYSALYRVWPDPGLRAALVAVAEHMMDRVFDAKAGHLGLFFDAHWNPSSDRFSPGHDLEAAWLLRRAAEVTGDAALLDRAKAVAVELARSNLQWIDADGGLVYEAGPTGVTDPLKQWWAQAEAVVGYLNAYELTGEEAFYAAAMGAWRFIERRFIDRRNGEWFGDLTRGGKVVRRMPKVSLWKCPYHNTRMCLEVVERAERLAASLG